MKKLSLRILLCRVLIGFLWMMCFDAHAQALRINEFMASNDGVLLDADGDSSDWIEIWNYGLTAISLNGFSLTDDLEEPDRWMFPDMTLAANSYLIVFASAKDRRIPGNELHTNFELNRSGESLALMKLGANGFETINSFESYSRFQPNYSFGFVGNITSNATAFFVQPSPGKFNQGAGILGFVDDTTFSVDRGYYDEPFDVVISTPTKGATLVYTLDGTIPTQRHGTRVTSPNSNEPPQLTLRIETTTLVRVMAFKGGYESTDVDTQSYLFSESLLLQNGRGEPFSQSVRWGHAGPDWAMDQDIVRHQNPDIRPVKQDFLRLPTLSVVMDFEEMFGARGIYIAGQSVEKNVSVEWINPESDLQSPNQAAGFQHDGTIQIVGGSSPNRWKSDKLSLRLKFDGDLRYPIFGDKATDRFDTIVLDARLNNVWHYGGGVEPVGQRNRAQYVRDQYAANLHSEMGGLSPHGQHAHIMINGIYWGIHTVHERPDDNFAASYLGGDNEDYDVVKHRPSDVLQGSSTHYNQLHSLAGRDLSDHANYDAVAELLDIKDFIDYMIMNYYIGNGDWAHHNWYASYNRVDPNGRWRFHSWDAEKGLHHVNGNVTGRNDNGGPTYLMHQLIRNESFRLQFADRAYQHLRYGVLSPVEAGRLYREISNPIDLPIRLESARWGDNQRSNPYTRLDWVEIRDSLFGESNNRNLPTFDYFDQRSDIVLNQFRSRSWLPSTKPPTFNQHGGRVESDFKISIEAESRGDVFYTLDGSDPLISLPTVEQTAVELITEGHTKRAFMPVNDSLEDTWFLPGFDDSSWPQARRGAGYENGAGYDEFIASQHDFQAQVNRTGTETIYLRAEFDLDDPSKLDRLNLGIRYDDGFIAYLNGNEVARSNAPGSAGNPVAWNATATGSHSDGDAIVFQTFDVSDAIRHLNQGKNVMAIHGLNVNATSSDMLIWPTLTGGIIEGGEGETQSQGIMAYNTPFSLTRSALVKSRVRVGDQWSPLLSAEFVVDATPADASNVILSAIHYHPSAPNSDEVEAGFNNRRDFEFLKLTNVSDQIVDLRGVKFTDGIEFSFTKEMNVLELNPGESLVICSNRAAYQMRYQSSEKIAGEFQNGTNLRNGGERIALVNAVEDVIAQVTYHDQLPWPIEADGSGSFLSLIPGIVGTEVSLPESWEVISEQAIRHPSGASEAYRNWLSTFLAPGQLNDPFVNDWVADPDNDGMNNLQEYFHGTHPMNVGFSANWPKIMNDPDERAAGLIYTFTKAALLPGVDWIVETSADLITWQVLPAGAQTQLADGERYSWNVVPASVQYFRLTLSVTE